MEKQKDQIIELKEDLEMRLQAQMKLGMKIQKLRKKVREITIKTINKN